MVKMLTFWCKPDTILENIGHGNADLFPSKYWNVSVKHNGVTIILKADLGQFIILLFCFKQLSFHNRSSVRFSGT